MATIKDIRWEKGISVKRLADALGHIGFQGSELAKVSEVLVRMRKANAKIYLTFTSNMVTSGLRGLFAQMIELKMAHVLVTTAGAIEEDIMKATGAQFSLGRFDTDDTELHEQGINRIGNILIRNEDYAAFEDYMLPVLSSLYKQRRRWTTSELLCAIGEGIDDEHSILAQAARHDVPIFCPAITDGAIGFHLYLFQQKHPDFIVDPVADFGRILFSASHDESKGIMALGGSVSKHFAILATLLNGGAEYAAYITTARPTSGSLSGATTSEAKSWGKIKDEADIATAVGDATILFPIAAIAALEQLSQEGLL